MKICAMQFEEYVRWKKDKTQSVEGRIQSEYESSDDGSKDVSKRRAEQVNKSGDRPTNRVDLIKFVKQANVDVVVERRRADRK